MTIELGSLLVIMALLTLSLVRAVHNLDL